MVMLLICLFVLITTLVKPMKQLNINTFCTIMFLAIRGHHEFKEIRFRFLVV